MANRREAVITLLEEAIMDESEAIEEYGRLAMDVLPFLGAEWATQVFKIARDEAKHRHLLEQILENVKGQ